MFPSVCANPTTKEVPPYTPRKHRNGRSLQGMENRAATLDKGQPASDNWAGWPFSLPSITGFHATEGVFIRPRIRSIKPEIWQSRDFMALPVIGKVTFFCLISHADDEGRLKTDVDHAAEAWLHVPAAEVKVGFAALVARKMIEVYVAEGEPCVQITHWAEHQRIDPRTANPSTIPPAPFSPLVKTEFTDGVTQPTGAERSGRERSGESAREENEASFGKPTVEEAQVVLKIQALGFTTQLRARTRLALETASSKGARDPVAFLSGHPEPGRVSLLEDLAIGWREEDRQRDKQREAEVPAFLGSGLLKRIS